MALDSSPSSSSPQRLGRRAALAALLLVPLAALLAFASTLLIDDEYQSTARVLPPSLFSALPRVAIFTNESGTERMSDQFSVRYQSELAMSVLRSGPILDAVVQQEDLARHFGTGNERIAREKLLEATRVSAGKDGVIAILVTAATGPKAASIANAYVTALERYVVELTNRTARVKADAIRQQLQLAQQRLRELDAAFSQVQRRTGILRMPTESSGSSTILNDLRQRLALRDAQLLAMSVYATAANSARVRISAEAAALRAQIDAIVGGPRGAAGIGSEEETQYQRALRDVRSGEETVDGLRKQLIQAEFESVSKLAGLQVIERATASELRSGPRRALIAAVAGLAAALVVILWFLWRLRQFRPRLPSAGATAAL